MTKQELRAELIGGRALSELLEFTDGQDCVIFKADKFFVDNEVCYIPDVDLNEIPIDEVSLDSETIDEIIGHCYTGNDFWTEAGGDAVLAERLFWYVDWQHPCSAVDEVIDDEECVEVPAARAMALLRGVANWMSNNIGVDSAIGNLFWLGATPEETIAIGFDETKVKALYATYEEDALPWI